MLVRGSLINSRERKVIESIGELAMFFAISNFTAVNRAAVSQSAQLSAAAMEASGA